MATINLGRIKPVWKNTWTATTAYVVDDIVRSGRASYICINAHTSAATFAIGSDWQLMSDGGVDGTDGTTVGTGTAGQVLKTNSAGNSTEWGEAPFPSNVTSNAYDFGNWTITETAGVLYFATGGVNKMKLDASGNLVCVGNVTAYGTV